MKDADWSTNLLPFHPPVSSITCWIRTLKLKRAWSLWIFTALPEAFHGEKPDDN
jgi:hypothetical protein